MNNSRIKFSLRWKLLLLSITVLIIPYIGFDYLRQMEGYLRDTLESSLVDSAYALAGALNDKPTLFYSDLSDEGKSLYVHELNHVVQLDGYMDEWLSYSEWSDTYYPDLSSNSDNFKLIISKDEHYYYVLIQVRDDNLVYSTQTDFNEINGDHFIIIYRDKYHRLSRAYLAPGGPGKIRPFRYEEIVDEYGVEVKVQKDITNTSAVWQETENGYNIEIKIPEYLIGERLGFIFNNVDIDSGVKLINSISTARQDTFNNPGRILRSSEEIKTIIYGQGRSEGRRVWVLDQLAQVLASDGSLKRNFPDNAFNIIYTLLLPPAYDQFKDDLAGASRLQGKEVKSALSGNSQTRWRSSPDGKAVIVSAATPVWLDNKVVGAVVVEETTNNIQIMQRQVLASLFNKTLLIFFVIVFLLLLFASRISSRLINLNRETTEVIDEYGKVKGNIKISRASDEIGELSRSFANMIDRLQQYHGYLEGMAGRLSHELRTPMAIVRSSLDRLMQESDFYKREEALKSADEGLQRLQTLLTRLSEASRLEQAIKEAEKEQTNINAFLQECITGYELAYPDSSFDLSVPDDPVSLNINRDLFFQMLDKLVSNAVEFSMPDKSIGVNLSNREEKIILQVINYGSKLPEGMAEELFNSMISIRDKRSDAGPHLGLGLYIARLIAEFHKGKISATNLEDVEGVCISIVFNRI
ncbi:MAG: proteobacterial dedicated sortase system histidine kinase [Proteobacteria bacterium]|nr:proteobacterial dedicated sortase system histidine kinase [Pseudomonadota bacterium]